MARTVEFKDPGRLELIRELKSAAKDNGSNIWSTVAEELSKVRRNRREVNVHKISRYTGDGDIIVVPGKVLGDGVIRHKVNVAAFRFTEGAEKKIKDAGGRTMSILELVKDNPRGSKVKLMG
ncbi:MAG: 50S ribosomal protein L18e [Candidatus Altiarchaeales archaeon]|nr:50S ribosomal protein L18e [Candidatus Altiarchaeales archaeon]MBD3415686.1 50S ribosomal protein L18e [Candidatus Altiarchaeales archaeon]